MIFTYFMKMVARFFGNSLCVFIQARLEVWGRFMYILYVLYTFIQSGLETDRPILYRYLIFNAHGVNHGEVIKIYIRAIGLEVLD